MTAPNGKTLCAACSSDVVPGTLFCWQEQHFGNAPKIGAYRDDHGQLLWASEKTKGLAEHALAVLVGGEQVDVRRVSEVVDRSPARLLLEYVPLGATKDLEPLEAEVSLATVFERILTGMESVDATRTSPNT